MNLKKIIAIALTTVLPSVGFARVIADNTTIEDFNAKKAAIKNKSVFSVFDNKQLTPQQREALTFLYAYMPLPDISDYSGDFHLANVNATFKAMEEMPWGKTVPDREFRHFVLPLRVNNENLDSSRIIFYEELKDRVKGLSMKDAILEVNHWCHEKATYQPSDGRTSNPLATVRSAIGRCGEESTFGVAALRSVGIPARQIYTPRWAHTDDNHAWVEAWADGQWYFLGACEPEAVLDLGWFNAPASRGIMMNTNAFGRYFGPEEIIGTTPSYTTINVTEKYAPVKEITAVVTDKAGKPVENAKVMFSVYNYAEYFPIATKTTNANGKANLHTGLGDLVVVATDGTNFGLAKASVGKDSEVNIALNMDPQSGHAFDWHIVPPKSSANLPYVSPEMEATNRARFAYEDSVRLAYVNTFFNAERAADIATELGYNPDDVAKLLVQARGNHAVIVDFLKKASTTEESRQKALALLNAVSEKDRRDISAINLTDHFNTPKSANANQFFDEYVMNPRVANEFLTPYKSLLAASFNPQTLAAFATNPENLIKWVADSISIEPQLNPNNIRMNPLSVRKMKQSDALSRDIFFVSLARTAGIPARIDPVTGKTQYIRNGENNWTDVVFDAKAVAAPVATPKGKLNLRYTPVGRIEDPVYNTQFSISKIVNGKPMLMDYPELTPYSETFGEPVDIDAGQYQLTTGQRMADGSVLARTEIFTINPDKTTDVDLIIRQDTTGVQVIGSFNAENLYTPIGDTKTRSLLSTSGRGYYIVGLLRPAHEPSIHALNDLSAAKTDLENWGRAIFLIFPDAESAAQFRPEEYPNLPKNVVFGIDSTGNIAKELPDSANLPSFIITDTFNRVVFESSGYTINLGERLADILHKIGE